MAPFRIAEEQGDRSASAIRKLPAQALLGIGGDREQHGIALRPPANLRRYFAQPGLARGQNAVETVAQPVILAIREQHHGRKAQAPLGELLCHGGRVVTNHGVAHLDARLARLVGQDAIQRNRDTARGRQHQRDAHE